jgi:hypothetical protein
VRAPRGAPGRRGWWCAALLVLPAGVAAQVAPNRTTLYLHPTDVTDARALWVNPAGLGRFLEASLHLDLTVGDPGAAGRLKQFTVGLDSRGFGLGYQRDVFTGGTRSHSYRLGFAGSQRQLAGGFAVALYRGSRSSTGWEVGVLYDVAPGCTIGGAVENIGSPLVGDSTLRVTYVPGATLRVAGGRGALSTHGRFTTDGVVGYAVGVRAGFGETGALPVRLLARLDTDRSLRSTGFAFGLSLGGPDVVGAVATTPGTLGRLDAVSLYGLSTRRFKR